MHESGGLLHSLVSGRARCMSRPTSSRHLYTPSLPASLPIYATSHPHSSPDMQRHARVLTKPETLIAASCLSNTADKLRAPGARRRASTRSAPPPCPVGPERGRSTASSACSTAAQTTRAQLHCCNIACADDSRCTKAEGCCTRSSLGVQGACRALRAPATSTLLPSPPRFRSTPPRIPTAARICNVTLAF